MTSNEAPTRVWERTTVSVIDLNLAGQIRRCLEVRLHIATIQSSVGSRQPDLKETTPAYLLELDAAEALAQQLLQVVQQARSMQHPPAGFQ